MRTVKALARLRGCAGSPEPSLVAYVISTKISWAGSIITFMLHTSYAYSNAESYCQGKELCQMPDMKSDNIV